MTILYLTFGQKTEYHVEACFSMLSFRRQMTPRDRIVVITTAPEFYRHAADWAEIVAIDDDRIRQWQGEYQFFWRVKIKAIEYIGRRYPDDDVLWLDCDTVLRGQLDELRRLMADGCGLMDTNDGHPSKMKTKTLRMWRTVAGHTYGGITLGQQHNMYCAGVVGIPHALLPKTVADALTLCDGMLADGAERVTIEQYSLSVSLYENTRLTTANHIIAHYWAAKDEWEHEAMLFISRIMLTQAPLDEQLRLFAGLPLAELPVYLHKSSTARRLRSLVSKLFPDRDHRYLK